MQIKKINFSIGNYNFLKSVKYGNTCSLIYIFKNKNYLVYL